MRSRKANLTATKEVSAMTSKQATIWSALSAVGGAIFLATPYGGSFPFSWSLIGGLVIGVLLRGWFFLSMRGARAIDAKVDHDPDKQFWVWFGLTLVAGLGSLWMAWDSGLWIFYLTGALSLLIGLPFTIWYRRRKKQQ